MKKICSTPRATEAELNKHYEQLSKLKTNPVLLALTDQFSDSYTYIPLYEQGLLPKPLSLLYEEVLLTFSRLLNKSESVYHNTKLTADQVKKVEEMTREQANSKLWFQQRCGRVTVTASKLRAVLHTIKIIVAIYLLPSSSTIFVHMVVNMRIRHVKLTWKSWLKSTILSR